MHHFGGGFPTCSQHVWSCAVRVSLGGRCRNVLIHRVRPILLQQRWVVNASRDGGREASSSSNNEREHASPHEQFEKQRQSFYKHSFHEKGSTGPHKQRSDGGADDGGGRNSTENIFNGGASTSATGEDRRQLSRRWEKAFFGRVHHEDGMHERFAAAVEAYERERAAKSSGTENESKETLPPWPAEESAPLKEFLQLSPRLQQRYIIQRLTMGSRRVKYAPDFGSLSMMYQLSLGEMMVREATELLNTLGWMNDELAEEIESIHAEALKIKYDFDLD